jgi:hypothetical protein
MSMPFSWGNTRLNTKYDAYREQSGNFNTLLIGASTTYRHINPSLFDSTVNAAYPELNIRSYNFGIPANRTPQTIYMLDNLLDTYGEQIKYVVIDLSELTKMGADNLHKKEMLYWYTWNNIGGVMKASYESEKGITNKYGVPFLHAFSFAEKSFLVGMGPTVVQQHAGLNIEPLSVGPEKNGFYSLDQEMHDDPEGDLAIRYNDLRTPDTIDYRTKRCQFLYDKYKDVGKNPNKEMEKQLLAIIKDCEKRDISVVVMLSQRLGDRYEYLIPLFNRLPEQNRIGFQDPSAYPQFNQRENLFDLAHLNETGSVLFTREFAHQWLERMAMQKRISPMPAKQSDSTHEPTAGDDDAL